MNSTTTDSIEQPSRILAKMPSWVNDPEKYPIIYDFLVEQGRTPKEPIPLAAVTKLLWVCWQEEDWFPKH